MIELRGALLEITNLVLFCLVFLVKVLLQHIHLQYQEWERVVCYPLVVSRLLYGILLQFFCVGVECMGPIRQAYSKVSFP